MRPASASASHAGKRVVRAIGGVDEEFPPSPETPDHAPPPGVGRLDDARTLAEMLIMIELPPFGNEPLERREGIPETEKQVTHCPLALSSVADSSMRLFPNGIARASMRFFRRA